MCTGEKEKTRVFLIFLKIPKNEALLLCEMY